MMKFFKSFIFTNIIFIIWLDSPLEMKVHAGGADNM